ncbi:MAG: GIY-YIG nuclease family protein [Candidatus Kryptoniota bacterium]
MQFTRTHSHLYISYQLIFNLKKDIEIRIGKLGLCFFPEGTYVYTGSARKNIEARLSRHTRKSGKRLHWHIDYLLSHPDCKIVKIKRSTAGECDLNQRTKGRVIIPGFGSSDCVHGCKSHLKLIMEDLK